jgi:hypothetical protein
VSSQCWHLLIISFKLRREFCVITVRWGWSPGFHLASTNTLVEEELLVTSVCECAHASACVLASSTVGGGESPDSPPGSCDTTQTRRGGPPRYCWVGKKSRLSLSLSLAPWRSLNATWRMKVTAHHWPVLFFFWLYLGLNSGPVLASPYHLRHFTSPPHTFSVTMLVSDRIALL